MRDDGKLERQTAIGLQYLTTTQEALAVLLEINPAAPLSAGLDGLTAPEAEYHKGNGLSGFATLAGLRHARPIEAAWR